MLFSRLRNEQEQRSKVIARFILARGKRWFLTRATWPGGIVFWLGMNALFLTFDHTYMRGRFLLGWEVVFFLFSLLVGFTDGLILWGHIKRIANTE